MLAQMITQTQHEIFYVGAIARAKLKDEK